MAAFDPRPEQTGTRTPTRVGRHGRSTVVRVSAPANDNRPPLVHLARIAMRVAALVVIAAVVAVLLR